MINTAVERVKRLQALTRGCIDWQRGAGGFAEARQLVGLFDQIERYIRPLWENQRVDQERFERHGVPFPWELIDETVRATEHLVSRYAELGLEAHAVLRSRLLPDQAAMRCVLLKDAIRFGFRVHQFSNLGIAGPAVAAFERCVATYMDRGGSRLGSDSDEPEEEDSENSLFRVLGGDSLSGSPGDSTIAKST